LITAFLHARLRTGETTALNPYCLVSELTGGEQAAQREETLAIWRSSPGIDKSQRIERKANLREEGEYSRLFLSGMDSWWLLLTAAAKRGWRG